MHFEGTPLEEVLQYLAQEHGLQFAYSPSYIPLDYRVSLSISNVTLSEALDRTFAEAGIVYREIAGQIVLRREQRKVERISSIPTPKEVPQQSPLYTDPRQQEIIAERRARWQARMPDLSHRQESGVRPTFREDYGEEIALYRLDPIALEEDTLTFQIDTNRIKLPDPSQNDVTRLAQISLLPFLGTNAARSTDLVNKVSVNLLWGSNGGVQGFELGGLGNNIRYNVQGIQVAGIYNYVGDDVIGTQFAGLANIVRDNMYGLQLAGGFNLSGKTDAVQAAGLFNVARGDFSGIQASTLFNYAVGDTRAIQLASLFNVSGGDARLQFSGLFNVAGNVQTAQASALLNVGKQVSGLQLGLINVADTVSGLPIGLLNIVKKGYNRVELSGAEDLYGNFAVKVGVKRFYNIFYLGARIDDAQNEAGEDIQETSWALGYGLGTAFTLSRSLLLNLEIISLHVNEKESWTSELNQLSKLRVLLDGRIGKHSSLFVGPVLNVMASRLQNPETGERGSSLPPYVLIERDFGAINTQAWVGFSAGIRF